MRLSSLWVVTDATESSTLADICWQASDPVQLANIIVGAGGSQGVARGGGVFYTTEAEAKRDARRRLQVAEIKSEQASAYRRDRQLTPADVDPALRPRRILCGQHALGRAARDGAAVGNA